MRLEAESPFRNESTALAHVGDDESFEVKMERSGQIKQVKATQLSDSLEMRSEGKRKSVRFQQI